MSTITITDNTIRIGIKSLITKFTGIIPDNVIAAFDNRTPIPKGSYAVMTPIQTTRHATNEDVYSTTAVKNIKAHLTAQYQIDFYGEEADSAAHIFAEIWQNRTGVEFLRDYLITPLTVDATSDQLYVNPQKEFEKRWILTITLSYYPLVDVPQDYVQGVDVDVITADLINR